MTTDIEAMDPLEAQGVALLDRAQTLTVSDDRTFALAAALRSDAKTAIREVEEFFRPLKRAADAAKKALLDRERAMLEPHKKTVEIVDRQLLDYSQAQARAKLLAEARAVEEAKATGEIVVPAAVSVPKAEGLTFSTHWHAEVTDPMALIRAVAEGTVSPAALMVNQAWLDGQARERHEALAIPGVKAVSERRARG